MRFGLEDTSAIRFAAVMAGDRKKGPKAVDQEITNLLLQWRAGDKTALDALIPQVYADLRQIARRELGGRSGHDSLQPTALVNEFFLRILGAEKVEIRDTSHLLTLAAKLMRQVLVDRARTNNRAKRGGGEWVKVDLLEAMGMPIAVTTDIEALDDALQKLAKHDERMATIVELRYFGGLEVQDVAKVLDVDERTVYRDWAVARVWLKKRLE